MLFDQLGIHGWDEIEPVVLAALASDLSVLFVGDIGGNKTEGAERIARALLGRDIEFRAYEVPTLNFDDLVGFVNPKTLAKGSLQFVPTPLSIWPADAVLLDEINRANPFIQSKLHELVRKRTLLGMPTNLKMVFSAVNPPETYNTGYMDLALASRFVCVPVPNVSAMDEIQIEHILSGNGIGRGGHDLRGMLARASAFEPSGIEGMRISSLCKKIMRDLGNSGIVFNARQLKMMQKLITSGLALQWASGLDIFTAPDAIASYIGAVIPEINGIVRTRVDASVVRGTIRTIVTGFQLADPMTMARNLGELLEIEPADVLAWAGAVDRSIKSERQPQLLRDVLRRLPILQRKGVIEHDLSRTLMEKAATRFATLTLIEEATPVLEIPGRIHNIIQSLKGEVS
ncbi:AAA domain (dynein-related subfamily) [Desulfatibacillum alkenivorans DSM 16219]|uniref:AAA domain (Dynein-related subfamily) n=1 Tax=Desulfatibacillum alkenivorans DSM 16219 TaxID=1121393 RepID=A0A1M6N5B2_9BACT|nr:AAA family ATPase [Desulfatibacillum alkenivorans]SHJ90816.1 AAA domain (dynein-related subfamily) [Desulfatibacillum alkenivorans DSM 16219]